MHTLVALTGLFAVAFSKACDPQGSGNSELLLSLNRELLRSLEEQVPLPNPSVHLALRLSNSHNLGKEGEHLLKLTTHLHNNIESYLTNRQPVVGLLALYTLALKASCHDLNTVNFIVHDKTETLLMHLKRQLEHEKEHITHSHRPLTNYFQYSQGILALCVSGVRVNPHVTNKLIKAHFIHVNSRSVDTLAMAGMALQCVKESGSHVQNPAELDTALSTMKQKLLDSQRVDGHIGNEFSTGLAVQALLAMGSQIEECATSMEAMRTSARSNAYFNPMAISQTLPGLQQKTYLHVKSMECSNEDDSLVLEPKDPVVVLPSKTKVTVQVEVVKSSGEATLYSVDVPDDSSLLQALELLQRKDVNFTFENESSLWGPFLSVVNGERARQSDRRYWHLSSEGAALSQGIADFKIETAQKIKIQNTAY